MKEIITLGEIIVEIMAKEKDQSFKHAGEFLGPYPSGAPAIFINQVAKMGVPAAILGCVGKDDFGFMCTDRLQSNRVSTRLIHQHEDYPTGTAFVTYKKNGNRDFIFNIRHSAAAHLQMSNQAQEALKQCSLFHVMGSSIFSTEIIPTLREAIHLVKVNGGQISFDPNVRKELLNDPTLMCFFKEILTCTDVFLPSGDELLSITETETQDQALSQLWSQGVSEVILKKGASGCDYFSPDQHIYSPPYKVCEIDATGAGDTFGATFLASRMKGHSSARSLELANAAGALAVSVWGPMEGASSQAELEHFIHHKNTDMEAEKCLKPIC
ncbi:MAG: sugar kinase [Marinomonas sp.]